MTEQQDRGCLVSEVAISGAGHSGRTSPAKNSTRILFATRERTDLSNEPVVWLRSEGQVAERSVESRPGNRKRGMRGHDLISWVRAEAFEASLRAPWLTQKDLVRRGDEATDEMRDQIQRQEAERSRIRLSVTRQRGYIEVR